MTQPLKSKSKKICLLGASAVGKTSLVKRFAEGIFDEAYRTTIGVHMYHKFITFDEEQVKLIFWDLEGKDDPGSVYSAVYLSGAKGYMLVADITRPDTLDVVKGLFSTVKDKPPVVLLLNKQDLLHSSSVTERAKHSFGNEIRIFKTSAKLDEGVNQAFIYLVKQMLEVDRPKGPEMNKLQSEGF